SPAQAHFDYGDVHAPRREVRQGDRGGRLEEAGIEALDFRLQEARPLGERLLADRHAVHLDALADRDQVGRRVQPDPEAAGPQLRRHEGAGGPFAVGPRYVHGGEMPLGMTQHAQEPLGRSEAPFDAAPLSREEKAAGVLEGQQAQSAASAGCRPPMWRSNWAVVSRSSLRGTTASTIPCSSRNSAVWNPGGRSWPMVCLITRGP